MFDSLFDVRLLIAGPAIITALGLFTVIGLLLVRRRVLPRWRVQTEQ